MRRVRLAVLGRCAHSKAPDDHAHIPAATAADGNRARARATAYPRSRYRPPRTSTPTFHDPRPLGGPRAPMTELIRPAWHSARRHPSIASVGAFAWDLTRVLGTGPPGGASVMPSPRRSRDWEAPSRSTPGARTGARDDLPRCPSIPMCPTPMRLPTAPQLLHGQRVAPAHGERAPERTSAAASLPSTSLFPTAVATRLSTP